MQRMNGTVQNLKEAWQKMPGKTKKMIAVIAAGTIILAAAGLLVLNIGTKKGYSTLDVYKRQAGDPAYVDRRPSLKE